MANEFDTVKLQASSEKFNLIRFEPARAVENDLVLSSGTTYTITFAFSPVSRVTVDGVSYTKVSSSPTSGQFSFDESTKLLTINLGVALTDQIVVVFYYLFFTKDKARVTFETPTDDSTPNRVWLPRISEDPSFDFNLRDITEGLISFGTSAITLSNQDGFFEQYFGDDDSWANKKVTIWLALEDVENVRVVFRGLIRTATISRQVSIEYFDEFSVLNKTFYGNGSFINSSFNLVRFPSLHNPRQNFPIYRLYAESSYYRVIDEGTATGLFKLSPYRLLEASCVLFSTDITLSTNRRWGTIYYEGDGGVQTDTVAAVDHTDANFSLIDYGTGKKYKIGDTLHFGGSKYARVLYVDTINEQIKTTKEATIAVSDTITRPGVSAIVILQNDIFYYPLFQRDYTVDYGVDNNNIISIQFNTDFESNVSMPSPLNPDLDQVFYRAWADTGKDLKHGSVVQEILETAGLTVDTASITAANTASSVKTNFYIPFVADQGFTTFANNLGKLLQSTFGYIALNNDLEFTYALFETPTNDNEVTDRQILLGSYDQFLDYNDIINEMFPENDHDIFEVGFTNNSVMSDRATYLHESSVSRTYNHVLADSSRMQSLFDYLSNRKGFFSFSTKTNPDVIIGDNYAITRDNIIGDAGSKNVTLIKVSKKATKTDVMGFDLLGV